MVSMLFSSVLCSPQESDEIRCAAIMLLGNLSKFGAGEPLFKDQIHNVLASLLLHLCDPNLQVVKVRLLQFAMPHTVLKLKSLPVKQRKSLRWKLKLWMTATLDSRLY